MLAAHSKRCGKRCATAAVYWSGTWKEERSETRPPLGIVMIVEGEQQAPGTRRERLDEPEQAIDIVRSTAPGFTHAAFIRVNRRM